MPFRTGPSRTILVIMLHLGSGNISHAKWLTANRILRLYVSTVYPSDQLLKLVKFIMQVYIPSWFQIKRCNSIINGPKNMHSMILRCQGQEEDVKNIIKPVIQRNAHFLHSENILLCMVHDEDNTMKELGWRKTLKSKQNKQIIAVRSFKIPDMNFEAENYHGLIDWNQDFTSPPLFHHIVSSGGCYFLAPPIWRRRFGAADLALLPFGAAVLALIPLGAGIFWRRPIWRRHYLAPTLFGAGTIIY